MQGTIPQLTFTRFIAATAVVVFHYGQHAVPFKHGFLHSVAGEAGITVSYFFFLSGFLLYHVYGNKEFSFRNFMVARLARIAPLYWFALAVTLFIILVLLREKPWGGTAILQAFFLQAWFPGNALSINGPAWSVSVEVFFYLMFPVLLGFCKRMGENRFLFFSALLWMMSIVQNILTQHLCYDPNSTEAGDFIMYFPLWHLNTFVCGMAAYILFARLLKLNTPTWLPLVFIVAGTSAVLVIITTQGFVHSIMHLGLLSPFYTMIVWGICLDRSVVQKVFSLKPPQFLGEISYGIYLLQIPVWLTFRYFIPSFSVQTTSGFYVFLLVLIVVSAVIYMILERPVREYIRRRFKSMTPEKV